jgi:serine phosphatase RsbU (regulator of sigma subunit)
MKRLLREYAWRILLLHLLVLAAVVAMVVAASREVYYQARQQAIQQAAARQRLLAWQTARGIESYYRTIFDTLDLIKRGNEQSDRNDRPLLLPRTPLGIVPLLWHQLDNRVTTLFAVDRVNHRVVGVYPHTDAASAQRAADHCKSWLKDVDAPTLSPLQRMDGEWVHLLCVPAPGPTGMAGRVLLVAVVPISGVELQFLANINRDRTHDVILADQSGLVMSASQSRLVGRNLFKDVDDEQLKAIANDFIAKGKPGSDTLDRRSRIGGRSLSPRLIQAEPIEIAGRYWSVLLSSNLTEVDQVVGNLFRRATWWAAFVVVAMTGILVSTSTQMIRSRLKLEQLKNELLGRELTQARRIQLAWLPERKPAIKSYDIAAVNRPASHVSGDFYDWFELPDGRLVVTIGDVTGHGIAAAFLMATTQLLVRTSMMRLGDPGLCLEEVNRELCAQPFNGQFVTALILVLDPGRNCAHAAAAGHFPPLVSDGQEFHPAPLETELVLGVEMSATYHTTRFELPSAFALLLYTDGVVEARSKQGQCFRRDRLIGSIKSQTSSAQELTDDIIQGVEQFRGDTELNDDLTLVAICSSNHPLEQPAGPAAGQ